MAATTGKQTALRWLPRLLVMVAIFLTDLAALGQRPAVAQEQLQQQQQRPPGIFGGLFMRREPQVQRRVIIRRRPQVQRQPQRQVVRRKSKKATVARAPAKPKRQVAETPAIQKLETARTVLVVGDFLGGGLADGLEVVFEDRPDIRVVDRTSGSSGFVRDDHYDWPGEIEAILDKEKPAAVVVMIGSNDRQEISGQDVLSPEWTSEYESRIEEFTTSIEERNIPLVWVGMPAFKSSSMTSGMLAFNDIYRSAAEAVTGGVFVDIWDGFVDENGNFTISGPDVNGQPVQLRSSDGINLTNAGRRKVAFYAEKPLDRILSEGAEQPAETPLAEMFGPPIPAGLGLAAAAGSTPQLGTDAEATPQIERTLPVSLDDPTLYGGAELLGGAAAPVVADGLLGIETQAETRAAEASTTPPPGRADNFVLRQDPTRTASTPRRPSR